MVAFGDRAGDRQAQAAAVLAVALGAVEAVEDARALCGRDAGALVVDRERGAPSGAVRPRSMREPGGEYLIALFSRLRTSSTRSSRWPRT